MVNLKPTKWKVIVSILVGILTALFNLFLGLRAYQFYQNTPGMPKNFSLWEIIVKNGYLNQSILGFIFAIITIYLIYSLFQKEKSKWWMALKLFLLFIVVSVIYIFIALGNLFGGGEPFWKLFAIYDVLLLIYIGFKIMWSGIKDTSKSEGREIIKNKGVTLIKEKIK